MALPYCIATLIYAFNDRDDVLLIQRQNQPNQGLWSPFGGKLDTQSGESPHACAARETREELGIAVGSGAFHLTGMISEEANQGTTHWLMFLFELQPRLKTLPPAIDEGRFQFFAREQLLDLPIPQTDREQIWPLFWTHRGGFFVAHCQGAREGDRWTLEESYPKLTPAHSSERPEAP